MRAFWPTTYKEEFSQIWDLHREQMIVSSFNLGYLQQRTITKFCENAK